MNFLAHAFLSFNDADILTGNMISDFVKGKRKFDYPVSIQNGIYLHRQIDNFTDFHLSTARAKEFFRPKYRLYSGAFVDIVYDHFLATDQKQFNRNNSLKSFTETTYTLLEKNAAYFPDHFQKMFPYMRSQNWLYEYRLKEGIHKSFAGLVHRALYLNESDVAFEVFNTYYDELKDCYESFFPELKSYTVSILGSLIPR